MKNKNSNIASIPLAEKQTAHHSDVFTISTFNLFNYVEPPLACYDFDRIYSAQQWQKKQVWIENLLIRTQASVIAFQEVFSIESLKSLVNNCQYPYFGVVDQPKVVDDHICRDPVVAIASKFPIIDVQPVFFEQETKALANVDESFNASRKIVRATIDVPHLGHCDFYIVHFKSKRSMLADENDTAPLALNHQLNDIAGRWRSSVQRGSEAVMLHLTMLKRRQDTGLPMVIMGDFNDELSENTLSHFTSIESPVNEPTLQLFDAWHLYVKEEENSKGIRQNTHYYGSRGSVLDYILLSCEFVGSFDKSIYRVSNYHVCDKHIVNPCYATDSESTDHAIVSVTLTLRD